MDLEEIIDCLATSGLNDADFFRIVATFRAMSAYTAAGLNLAEVVLANESYQPSAVLTAVGGFYAASTLANAA